MAFAYFPLAYLDEMLVTIDCVMGGGGGRCTQRGNLTSLMVGNLLLRILCTDSGI